METVYIYGLEDPRDNEIHYVGKSINPKVRFRQHLTDNEGNQYKIDWLTDLQENGLKPNLVILDEATASGWRVKERAWITKGLEQGWQLTNIRGTSLDPVKTGEDFNCLQDYLTQENWNCFESLEETIQSRICLVVGKAVASKSEFAARAQGWRDGWYEGYDFLYGSQVANRLVENLGDIDILGKTVDNELSAALAAMNTYLVTVHGFSKAEIGLE